MKGEDAAREMGKYFLFLSLRQITKRSEFVLIIYRLNKWVRYRTTSNFSIQNRNL